MEKKSTGVFIINTEKGKMGGSVQQTPGYYESFLLRNHIAETSIAEVQKEVKKDFGTDVEITNFRIDSLDKLDLGVGIKYDFDIDDEKADIIYFNPMCGEAKKENPFKSANRFYPVEMPFRMDETYILHLEIPEGYVVDELPKSIVIKLNEAEDGYFEYRISESGGAVALRSRIRLNRSYFSAEEYEMLREFYNLIVSKHAEQVVFKKKK
jgi:hypothetical protein